AIEAIFLRKAHGLRAAVPKQLGGFGSHIYLEYISSIYIRNARSASFPLCRAARGVTDADTRLEAAALIKAVNARVGAAALQQDMVTVFRPCFDQGRLNHRAAISRAAKLRVRDDILKKTVAATAA